MIVAFIDQAGAVEDFALVTATESTPAAIKLSTARRTNLWIGSTHRVAGPTVPTSNALKTLRILTETSLLYVVDWALDGFDPGRAL
jgi:hypothetical protein